MKDLSERRLSSRLVYDGKLLKVRSDTVRLPDGGTAEREFIEHPGAVAVIALTDAGELVMERQFRYALGRDMIEIPAGKIDAGEDPLATARRELKEETGYTAAHWRHVATIHIAIGYSNERIEIYIAKGLKDEGAKLDDEEFLEVFTLAPATALAWVREGKITDAKTIAGLFWAEKVLGGEWNGHP
ncbi:MAG TPA: NUDIX hydrolase [Burkholderiales bacterium]|nr:NUDIX hydrolase [Burkholderiales bacterium]